MTSTTRISSRQMEADAEALQITVVVEGDIVTVFDEVEHWQADADEFALALHAVAERYRAGKYDRDEDGRPIGAAYDALCAKVTAIDDHVGCGRC